MIILKKVKIYNNQYECKLVDVKLEKIDYGVSFADLLSECDIEGHQGYMYKKSIWDSSTKEGIEYVEVCNICGMKRDVIEYPPLQFAGRDGITKTYYPKSKYGVWRMAERKFEESDGISKEIDGNPKCPKCKKKKFAKHKDNGIFHTDGKNILYDCFICNEIDQVYA